jgi:hypothetical protein
MWKCPKCKREFAKTKQTHSCRSFPLEKHFENKEYARTLFDEYVKKITKEIGQVKIESLPCCIHLVSDYTFGAVWAMKDRIRIDFRVDHKVENIEPNSEFKMSANRYLYHFDIKEKKDISKEIIELLRESYNLHNR